jgi:hypothetical protein
MTEPRITMRVRPFEKLLMAENNVLKCSGRIDSNTYVLNIGEGVHRLPIVGTGSDGWGLYALIEPSKTTLPAGFVLRVEVNYEEPDESGFTYDPGCHISLVRPPKIDPAFLRAQGIDPTAVNVLALPDASVSIYFNAAGRMDGYAMAAHPEDGQPIRPQ